MATKLMAAKRVIAFDFGTRSIGIAAGQSLTGTATELTPIRAKDGIPNWQEIETLLKEWKPDTCLVGLPLNMDGTESEFSIRAKKFANRLHGRFGVQIELYDERLSTVTAKSEAQTRGHRGNYSAAPIDSIAARIILESWFNSQN